MKATIRTSPPVELDGSPEEIGIAIGKAFDEGIERKQAGAPAAPEIELKTSEETGPAKKPRKVKAKRAGRKPKVIKAEKTAEVEEEPKPEKRHYNFGRKAKKKVASGRKTWTDRDDESLITDVNNGRKPEAIAATFGVSRAKIYNRIAQLRKEGRLPRPEGD